MLYQIKISQVKYSYIVHAFIWRAYYRLKLKNERGKCLSYQSCICRNKYIDLIHFREYYDPDL